LKRGRVSRFFADCKKTSHLVQELVLDTNKISTPFSPNPSSRIKKGGIEENASYYLLSAKKLPCFANYKKGSHYAMSTFWLPPIISPFSSQSSVFQVQLPYRWGWGCSVDRAQPAALHSKKKRVRRGFSSTLGVVVIGFWKADVDGSTSVL
jgi:hypothetical protein